MTRINPWNTFFGSMIPNWLMDVSIEEISQGAKLCYARLVQFGGKSGVAFPRMATLSAELGVSEKQTRRYVKELVDLKLVHAVDRRAQSKPHQITFLEHEWMPPLEARKNAKPGKKTPGHMCPEPPDISVPTLRTYVSGQEETQGKGLKEVESLSPAGAGETALSPDPVLPDSSKAENAAAVSGTGLIVKPSVEDIESLMEATSVQAEKNKRATATKQIASLQAREQLADNLRGKNRPPSARKARARCERIFFDGMQERYPDVQFAKEWGAQQRSICHSLIERYSGPLIEQALQYLISEWDSINARMFKGKGKVPGLKVLSACHDSLVPESQQHAVFAKVEAERDAWFKDNPHGIHLPADLKKRFAAAKAAWEGKAA